MHLLVIQALDLLRLCVCEAVVLAGFQAGRQRFVMVCLIRLQIAEQCITIVILEKAVKAFTEALCQVEESSSG